MYRKEERQPVFEDGKIFIEHGPELRILNWTFDPDINRHFSINGIWHMRECMNASTSDFSCRQNLGVLILGQSPSENGKVDVKIPDIGLS